LNYGETTGGSKWGKVKGSRGDEISQKNSKGGGEGFRGKINKSIRPRFLGKRQLRGKRKGIRKKKEGGGQAGAGWD